MKNVLMIDDDLDDQYFYRDLFAKYTDVINFECVVGQDELIRKYKLMDKDSSESPSLIILDLNLPKISGKDIFKGMHHIEAFNDVPVIVLTTSSSPMDMADCKAMGIQTYFVKPVEYHECEKLVDVIYAYWFGCNELNKI